MSRVEERFCYAEPHDAPCPRPCSDCDDECDPEWTLTQAEAIEAGLTTKANEL